MFIVDTKYLPKYCRVEVIDVRVSLIILMSSLYSERTAEQEDVLTLQVLALELAAGWFQADPRPMRQPIISSLINILEKYFNALSH